MLLCSDIGYHLGDVEAVTEGSIVERARAALAHDQETPLSESFPNCTLTEPTMERLAELKPRTLALMHGSTYVGDGATELRGLGAAVGETVGKPT